MIQALGQRALPPSPTPTRPSLPLTHQLKPLCIALGAATVVAPHERARACMARARAERGASSARVAVGAVTAEHTSGGGAGRQRAALDAGW